jgi:HAD domain in Swiss Army Knife RNA repair proteins
MGTVAISSIGEGGKMGLPSFDALHGAPDDVKKGWWDKLARTIALDFDGVLHPYTKGWQGSIPEAEEPSEGALEFLQWCKANDYLVVVFSTRANHLEGMQGIADWLALHGLSQYIEDITHEKPPAMAYVDDRAVPFTGGSWIGVYAGIQYLAQQDHRGAAKS